MPKEEYLKLTYNGPQKVNAYLRMPSPTFAVLYREIALCLFEERKLPECELKAYWIDDDGDDIEIFNQNDYEIFMSKRSEHHLHVAPRNVEKMNNNGSDDQFSAAGDVSNLVVHDRIECDACDVGPIIGFRYKCIECNNFDLCQRCEALHKHPEHMMVRMPFPNSPSVIEAWISDGGRWGRRASKRAGKSSNSVIPIPPYISYDYDGCDQRLAQAKKENRQRHERKHHRRQMRNGIFSHLYDMMQGFAEGGATNRSEGNNAEGAGAKSSASATANANVEAQVQNAVNEAVNASEIAAKAAAVAANRAMEAAGHTPVNAEFTFPSTPSAPLPAEFHSNCEPMEEAQSFVKVNPVAASRHSTDAPMTTTPNAKTPPPTPDTTAPSAAAKATKETNTNTEGESIPVTPTLENLAQFVDPMYMKAGIQILNNFSEMFAKMLDHADGGDGGDGGSCPFLMDFNQKNSTNSNTSKTSSNSSSANFKTTKVGNNDNAKKDEEVASTSATATTTPVPAAVSTATAVITASILEPIVVTPVEASQSRRRSQNDDSEWQLIEKQFENSSDDSADVSTALTLESLDGITSMDINFEQLSKDLREHVENEKKREERAQANEKVVTAATVETVTIDAASTAVEVASAAVEAATAVAPAGAIAAAETTKPYDKEKRYHPDDFINGAVHAMMAMGFSNEGAWLTQLLESVNGNISEALDIMSAAQRHNNNNK